MSYRSEKEAIKDVTKGSRCYYLTVRLFIHPFSMRTVYYANRLKLHPNFVSFLCVIFSLACLYLFFRGIFLPAFLCFYIRTVFDYADGALARYSGKLTRIGYFLDRWVDEVFYGCLWLLIACKLGSFWLAVYFLASAVIYRLITDLYIWPRLSMLEKRRAPLKQFFIDRGIILGFGVFTVLEFWVLFIFAFGIPRYYAAVCIFLSNLDIAYRLYELLRYGEAKTSK